MDKFETKNVKMPRDPSDDVVRAQLAEPTESCFAPVPGSYKWDHDIKHVPSPTIGKKI